MIVCLDMNYLIILFIQDVNLLPTHFRGHGCRGAQPLERVMLMYNNFRGRMLARQKRKQRQVSSQCLKCTGILLVVPVINT